MSGKTIKPYLGVLALGAIIAGSWSCTTTSKKNATATETAGGTPTDTPLPVPTATATDSPTPPQFAYVIAGRAFPAGTPAVRDSVYSALIGNGTIGSFTAQTPYPLRVYGHGAAQAAGKAHVSGGLLFEAPMGTPTFAIYNNSYSATLSAGSVTNWTAGQGIPGMGGARFRHGISSDGTYLYSTGGTGFGNSNQTFSASLALGTVGTWNAGPNLASSRYGHGAPVHGDHLYVLAGVMAGNASNATHYSVISPVTGAMGAWTSTVPLPLDTRYAADAVSGSYLYLVGGVQGPGGGPAYTSTVYVGTIGATGAISSWTTTLAYPLPIAYASGFAVGGYLYVLGGFDYTSGVGVATSAIYAAQIQTGGALGTWMTAGSLAEAVESHRAVAGP